MRPLCFQIKLLLLVHQSSEQKKKYMITDAEFSIFSKSVCACTFIGSFSVSAKSFCITAVDVRGTLIYILSKKN